MTEMIESYKRQIGRIDERIEELRSKLCKQLQTMQREELQQRIELLEESRSNLVCGINQMMR